MKQLDSECNNRLINDIQSDEYIVLDEALRITGLAEKTLRNHLRGQVTIIGRCAWNRRDFFSYWKRLSNNKQTEKRRVSTLVRNMLK